jgi:hypothetical protein
VPKVTSGTIYSSDIANFSETYDTKNAGTGKTLTPSGIVNDGNNGNNYTYSFITDTTGVINPAALTITAQTNTKTYDGTTSASAVPKVTSGTIYSSDIANFSETYDTKNAGTGKTLAPSGIVNDGNNGNNYTYTFVPNYNGIINPGSEGIRAIIPSGLTSNSYIILYNDGRLALNGMSSLPYMHYPLTPGNPTGDNANNLMKEAVLGKIRVGQSNEQYVNNVLSNYVLNDYEAVYIMDSSLFIYHLSKGDLFGSLKKEGGLNP